MNFCRFVAAAFCATTFAFATAGARAADLPSAPPAPGASFDVGSLHVDRYGAGSDAVILIPGLACGPWEWYGVIPHLAATKRVYVVTLPGTAGRPASTAPAGTLFASTEKDLAGLIAHENLKSPVVVGHSLGGSLAIGFAETYPLLARAIVSVDALPISLPLAYQPPNDLKIQADSAAASFDAEKTPALLRQYLLQNAATIGVIDASLMDQVIAKEALSDHGTATNDLRELLETDMRPLLPKVVAPVLILVPYYLADSSTPPSVQPPIVFSKAAKIASYKAVLAGLKHVQLAGVEPARHFIQLDDLPDFDATLDAFLMVHPAP